jgi:hypothetical protein
MLEDWWDSIQDAVETYRAERSSWVVLATGAGALLVVLVGTVWRRARNVVTIVHEGGHAVAALVTGRRLTGIRLHSDTSGLTLSVGKPHGLGMVVTAAAGYLSPSLVGLAGVVLLAVDQVTILLWVSTVVLAGMLVMIRNLYGVLSLVVTGGAVVAVSLLASPDVQAAFGYAMTWFLLLGGVRPVGELVRQRHRYPGQRTDADHLARLTHLPAGVWVLLFGVATIGALVAGTWLLLA